MDNEVAMEQYHVGLWINGKEVPAESQETFPVLDPGRGEVIGTAARGSAADIDRAVEAAHKAFRSRDWHGLNPHQRGRLLWALARKIEDRGESLARLLSLENGKPLREARDEIETTVRTFEYYAGWVDKIHGRVIPLPDQVFDYILYEPLGVVGHIIPWNYPLDIFARGVAPCLAVGNTVVVKPAEETPFGAIELARLAAEVGIPDGVINVVPGFGPEAGASLAAHPGIQGLAFCGSVATGKAVLTAAAQQITPVVSLELGGKSPCIVFADADIEKAIISVARGICHNAGQSCGARSRLLVPKSMLSESIEIAKTAMATVRVGYWEEDSDMGPLISEKQLERVLGYIEVGQQEYARLIHGGRRLTTGKYAKGYYIEPTLFADVQPQMHIAQEEIFGPVLSILTFDSESEAVEIANDSMYGISAEIWTRDLSRAHRVAAQLDVSHVTINGTGGFGIEAPFGGVKQSGFGREGGWESILQYSRVKNVWVKIESNNL